MKSALIWLDALLHLPRLLRRWWYVRKLPASQLQELMALQEGQEGREGPERLMILDVRSREEFTGELGHLDGAVLLPRGRHHRDEGRQRAAPPPRSAGRARPLRSGGGAARPPRLVGLRRGGVQ